MTKLEALKELKAKVEAGEIVQANEASNIWPTTYDKEKGQNVLIWNDACKASQGSIDAAKALHEAVLPGLDWGIDSDGFATITYPTSPFLGHWPEKNKDNPARAWLIAIISALIAQEES